MKSKAQSPKPKVESATQRPLADWAADQAKVANISELSRASGKDRATVVKMLTAAGLKPRSQRAKEKFYDLAAATEALARSPHDVAPLTHARTQKTTAEAARIVLNLQRERGELAPRSEFREEAFNLVKAMHTRLTRYAKSEAWNRLRKAKTRGEFERTIATDVALIFDDLKRDYPDIL
jgi:hypothetical protein